MKKIGSDELSPLSRIFSRSRERAASLAGSRPNQASDPQALVELVDAPTACGLAKMTFELIRGNLRTKPQLQQMLTRLRGRLLLYSEDAQVSTTLVFANGHLRVHSGVVGLPHITVRGPADDLMSLNLLETTIGGLPDPRGKHVQQIVSSLRQGTLKIYGSPRYWWFLIHAGHLMAIEPAG